MILVDFKSLVFFTYMTIFIKLPIFLGTKHIDPDTGLIYFKYDFGYEFGIILPGEGKKIDKSTVSNDGKDEGVPFPVLHIKTDGQTKERRQTTASKPPKFQKGFSYVTMFRVCVALLQIVYLSA